MKHLALTFLVAVVLCLCAPFAYGQQDDSAKARQTAEEALRRKAFDLLESLAGQLTTLQSSENRARIASNIAGSIWTHNEKRARELFAVVQQEINAGLQTPDTQEPDDNHTLMVFLKLRADTIERIAKHDPEFAYSFLKATELSRERKLAENVRANEEHLETHLAKQLLARSPELTLQLARKLLERDFSGELPSLVRRLNNKDKEKGAVLYKEIVRKLGDADLENNGASRYFAFHLANYLTPPEVEETTFRELVNIFVNVAVKNGCTGKLSEEDERAEVCLLFAPAVRFIAKVDAARAAQLQRWVSHGDYFYFPSPGRSVLYELQQEATVDEILAINAEHPELKEEIGRRAFWKARFEGDLERARKILAEYTADPVQRRLMEDALATDQAKAAVDDEKLEEIQKRLNEIDGTHKRFVFLLSVANGTSDRKKAVKLLDQARDLVDQMKPGKEQVASQMALAMIYCYQKSDRGFGVMASLVPKLNELIAASAKLDGYERRHLRDGEWNMAREGNVGELLNGLSDNAAYFAWCDFDRAVSMAGEFERPEIRIMAQLKLAQGILAGPPKRLHLPPIEYGP